MPALFRMPGAGGARRSRAVRPPVGFAAVYVMPRPVPRPVRLVVLDCPACKLRSGPFPLAEADQLAGTHDDLIHGGRPIAVVSPDPDSRPTFTVGGPTPDGAA